MPVERQISDVHHVQLDDTPLSLERVRAAAARLRGIAHRTALLTCSALDEQTGAKVFLKPEQFQRSGSFKFRGAYNRLSQLSSAQREAGVVAYSSGNHGAAVALAAFLVGTHATVVVPEDAAEAKVSAIAAYGADIRKYDPSHESREEIARELAASSGSVLVPPFDDYDIMAGQGTLALELAADAGELDVVIVPVGGGGLIAGVGTVISSLMPRCRVIGVEPATADDTRRSLQSGDRYRLGSPPETIADGLRVLSPGEKTFAVNRRFLDSVVVVTEEQIVEAMRFCFERMKVVVEPSGAVGVAALLSGAVDGVGRRAGVVLSGGNVTAARFAELVER
ncbi:MAG TPA: threonine/serine dehydratase [Acidimicrobiales bacterium]|nr:threonine/serine dehydratase [Acidimicrobiales bacterium]